MTVSEMPTGELLRELAGPEDRRALARFSGPLRELARPGLMGGAGLMDLGPSTRHRLAVAFELGRRRSAEAALLPSRVSGAPDVLRLFVPALRDEPVEVFRVLLLDARSRILAAPEISRGTLNASLVHPREVFRPALAAGSAAVIVIHNHPSGDPTPSGEDHAVTRRLASAGRLLGIPVLDHVVIGDGVGWSYRERGHPALDAVGAEAC